MMRRAIKAGATMVELVRRRDVFLRDNWMCHLCGDPVPEQSRNATGTNLGGKSDPMRPAIDHVIPLSKGGGHTMANCKTAHGRCNSKKWNNHALPTETASVVVHIGDPEVLCSVVGCPRGVGNYNKGMCRAHYTRLQKTGDPLKAFCQCGCRQVVDVAPNRFGPVNVDGHGPGGVVAQSVADQLRTKVRFQPVTDHGRSIGLTDDCHIWTGAVGAEGYGTVSVRVTTGKRKAHQTHRAAYEAVHGSVTGLVVDHLCRERACFNVNHLEAIAHAENLRRGSSLVEACPKGHPYTEDNLRDGQAGKACRQCHNDRYHVRVKGHEFVADPSNPSTKRARCLTCRHLAQPAQ